MKNAFVFSTRQEPEGRLVQARGIIPGVNFVFNDTPEIVILPALDLKKISSAKNTLKAIFLSKQIAAAFLAKKIEILLDGSPISTWAQLDPAAVDASANTFNDGQASTLGNIAIIIAPPDAAPSPSPGPSGTGGATVGNQVFNETPYGTINGVNDTFQFLKKPNPTTALQLYKNGLLQRAAEDFVFVGADKIRFLGAAIPTAGDTLLASYPF